MMWLVGGAYCFVIWLVFDKLRLLRFSLPIAILAGSIGPAGIVAVLFCAQYYHPLSKQAIVLQKVIPIVPQMKQAGRVTIIHVAPNTPVKQGEPLFEVDKVPFENAVNRLTAALAEAEQSVKVAEASVEVAAAGLKRATSDLEFATTERDRYQELLKKEAASQDTFDRAVARYEQASAALDQATTGRRQADLNVELSNARQRQAEVALEDAKYDLAQTNVIAPGDGYVTNLQLQPGMLVGGAGATSVMSFIQDRGESDQGVIVAMFGQKNFLLMKPDQYAEVILDGYPGQVFTGKVQTLIDVSGAGQLTASGVLPDDIASGPATRFAVRIVLDEGKSLRLPAGSRGWAAVYTDNVQIAGIPIMFVMRAESWLNYIF